MTKLSALSLLVVVLHWIVAIWHLFLAANILPAPNNQVNSLAVILITVGHLCVAIALWLLSEKIGALVSLVFFLAAMSADLYEHFLHASLNNVFMVASGGGTAWFDASVGILLGLEMLGGLLAIRSLSKWASPRPAA